MDRERATAFIDELHDAQQELYGGGGAAPVRRLLDPNVVWHVPGESPIAGRYEGAEEVIAYMLRRRDLADGSFRMGRRELMVGEGEVFAALTDGIAIIDGRTREWSTMGLYRLRAELLVECRLLPFDQSQFDEIWGAGRS
jgi:ketosteroid isomerase-like protein